MPAKVTADRGGGQGTDGPSARSLRPQLEHGQRSGLRDSRA
jgi:hypothetical protein